MSRQLEYLFGILIVAVAFGTFVNSEDGNKPIVVTNNQQTKGVVGSIEDIISPFTNVFLEYVNSALIHMKGEQLPCTIFNLTNFKYACTPVPGATTEASSS